MKKVYYFDTQTAYLRDRAMVFSNFYQYDCLLDEDQKKELETLLDKKMTRKNIDKIKEFVKDKKPLDSILFKGVHKERSRCL